MSYNSSLNADVVKTELDDVFMQAFNPERHPGYVGAESSIVFNQDTTDKAAEQQEIFKGVGLWDERAEEEPVASDDPRITNKITFNVVNYAKSIDVPKNFFDDNMHGAYEKMTRDFGIKGRITMDDNACYKFRACNAWQN